MYVINFCSRLLLLINHINIVPLEPIKGTSKKEPLEPLSVGALIAESQKQAEIINDESAETNEEIQSLIQVMQILAADGNIFLK
jgi:hypothetical protein